MGLILPDVSDDTVSRIQTDVKGALSNSNPWLEESFIRALCVGLGRRTFDYYAVLKDAMKQMFPATASGEYLQFWATLKNMLPLYASAATGKVTFTGNVGTAIPSGTIVEIGGMEYETDADATIAAVSRTVDSLTASGTVGTCVTDDDHEFAVGNVVTIAGANETAWNDDWTIIAVPSAKSFQVTVPLAILSPATGTITASADVATGDVTSSQVGSGVNQDADTEGALQSPIAGIDDEVIVQYGGIAGGADAESEEDYQKRIDWRWKNPLTPFNPANIEATIRGINGNTRVWVHRVTPQVGCVTAYFVRDNDASIIPDAPEEAAALAAVLAIAPGNTEETDVIVKGPTGIEIDIIISSLVPDTLSMRAAVEDTISAFYRGGLDEGEDHVVDKLKAAIYQTYDVVKGVALESFTLDSPVVDQAIAQGEIAIEGTVTINE